MENSVSQSTNGGIWSSNNPSIIEINQKTGEAKALSEGKADILLSNHIHSASIVFVSKIRQAEIDEKSRKSLLANIEGELNDKRVRIKLYLKD